MIKNLPYAIIILLALCSVDTSAQSPWSDYEHLFTPVRTYVTYRSTEPITIDGVADEASWAAAPWSEDFVDIEGDKKPVPQFRTRMKMLWDDQYLYALAEMEEPHIWCYFDERDQIVFHENDIELFFDPDQDGINYFEFEVNAQNTLFDLFLPKSYRSGGMALTSYNSLGFESAVTIDGSLNDATDTDHKWTVEMKIPLAELLLWSDANPMPQDGDQWRMNFLRVNWQTQSENGTYKRKTDAESGKLLPEYNWSWSAPGIISLHAPERYGLMQFSEIPAGEKEIEFTPSSDQDLRDCCWLVFYKQQAYKSKHKKYAISLKQLDLKETLDRHGKSFTLSMPATEKQFTVLASSDSGKSFSLNNEGFIQAQHKK